MSETYLPRSGNRRCTQRLLPNMMIIGFLISKILFEIRNPEIQVLSFKY